MTTDALTVLRGIRPAAAKRDQLTPRDLAAALVVPLGNVAALWPDAPAAPVRATRAKWVRFGDDLKQVLEESLAVAQRHRAGHIGTEHLLAALVHTGPADVAAWLAERGATAEAVDALLARLDGGPGVEQPPEPTPAVEREWPRATSRAGGRAYAPVVTAVLAVAVVAGLFVLCVWGP